MNWTEACLVGNQGVTLVLPMIQLLGNTIVMSGTHPITLTNQRLGVDCITQSRLTGEPIYVEIKTEQHTSDNIFVETVQNRGIASEGWFHTIQSDLLVWVFLDYHHGYLMRVNPLFEWVNDNSCNLPVRCSDKGVGYTPAWTSITSELGPENIQAWDILNTDRELQNKLQTMHLL